MAAVDVDALGRFKACLLPCKWSLNGQGDGYCPRDLTAPNRALCSLSYTLFEIGLVNEAMLDLSGGFQAAFFLGKLRASFCMAKLASPFGFIGT